MDEISTEWLMTLPRITEFLAALELNLPCDSFLKDFSCTKHHHLVFAGVFVCVVCGQLPDRISCHKCMHDTSDVRWTKSEQSG